jgi:predicted PurR-regulated permease PerM
MRTYGQQALRGLGATTFLGLLGTTAALIPIAIFALFSNGQEQGLALYAGASVIGGGAIGWILRR